MTKSTVSLLMTGTVFFLIFMGSCRSYKTLDVMRDVDQSDIIRKKMPVYKIRPNDNLFVSIITSNPELNKIYNPAEVGFDVSNGQMYQNQAGQYVYGYKVDMNGNVSLPILGNVHVGGLSIEESEVAVREKASEFLKEMSIRVRLLNYKVTVIGEVKKPGVIFAYNTEYTILDALSDAGGFTDFANINKVKVVRPDPAGDKVYIIDVQDESSLMSPAFYTMPNDIISISPARNKNVALRAPGLTLVLAAASTVLLLLNVLNINQ